MTKSSVALAPNHPFGMLFASVVLMLFIEEYETPLEAGIAVVQLEKSS